MYKRQGEDDDHEIVVGRGKDCAFRAGEGDATVSRRHVAFRASRDGKLYCRDLGSTHGTRAGAVEIGTEWTEVELGEDGATETVTLGRGPTTVTCERRDEDDGLLSVRRTWPFSFQSSTYLLATSRELSTKSYVKECSILHNMIVWLTFFAANVFFVDA